MSARDTHGAALWHAPVDSMDSMANIGRAASFDLRLTFAYIAQFHFNSLLLSTISGCAAAFINIVVAAVKFTFTLFLDVEFNL